MKIFERTGGYWLFWWSAVYFIIGMIDVFVLKTDWFPWIQLLWLGIIALPLFCNPLARWLNMKENHMFDFFKKKDSSNVIKFPEPKAVPEVAPQPEPEPPAKIFYRIGATDQNRISFQMGHMEITMNREGIDNMIKQLEVFRDQLQTE
jgi:hypothetical protein